MCKVFYMENSFTGRVIMIRMYPIDLTVVLRNKLMRDHLEHLCEEDGKGNI